MKFLGPITCIILNFFKISGDDQKIYDMLMMLIYYIVFYTQGIFDHCYTAQSNKYRSEILNSAKAPLFFGLIATLIFACEPSNYTGTGSIFVYPIYTDHYVQGFYTTGTWLWIMVLIWAGEAQLNDKFHAGAYDFV